MNDFIGPEFNALPEHVKNDHIPDNVTDLPQKPGTATALFECVTAAIDQWHDEAEDTGVIHLSTFDGQSVTIQRLEHSNEGTVTNPTPQRVAVKGIRGWLQRRRQARASVHHTITFSDGDTTTELTNIQLPGGATSLRGTQTIATDKGPQTVQLRKGIGLEDAAERARELVANGFPLSAEAAIAERQKQPCVEIIGNEAMQVQKALEAIITPNRATDLGNRTASERLALYEVVQPNTDDQWSPKYLTVIERQGEVIPSLDGVEGRSVLSTVNFSSTVLNSQGEPAQLIVRVEGVYEEGTNRLLGAQVTYGSKVGVFETEEPLAVGPEDRQAIHAAIMHQVTPDNVMRTHEFKPE